MAERAKCKLLWESPDSFRLHFSPTESELITVPEKRQIDGLANSKLVEILTQPAFLPGLGKVWQAFIRVTPEGLYRLRAAELEKVPA